ncbi:Uma2 family endonuclease [Argonema antarcticum]|uniref:Uma2 family endonuclease n=1 Tax=Argonema antarcticum TaxID=2942763 RepID=UPI00201309F1|nr:Uma2 family endonuclease [Argonema antarcticum]MCL1475508.1 Uma2 family endonuclease [Argonema antarcticum A004/B2]
MTRATIKHLTFEEYVELYPDGEGLYELVDGEIVELQPSRRHEEVTGELAFQFTVEIKRLKLNYVVPHTSSVKPIEVGQGRLPDVIVVDKAKWRQNWSSAAALSGSKPAQLVVEVVSTNWKDDYETKKAQYESLQIPEYWIVDFLSKDPEPPKVPKVSVLLLIDGKYQKTSFTGNDRIISLTFPELELTAEQVLWAGEQPGTI